MAYDWDVFLSYRRFGEWPSWIAKHFQRLLYHWLGEELGEAPRIFVDVEVIEVGFDWPATLAAGLATSKTMVALWSRQYFSSRWCRAELSQMLARERACGVQSHGRLILPAVIHDGEDIPHDLRRIQHLPLQSLSNPRITSDSPTGERLSDAIAGWAPAVKAAIERAPPWDATWHQLAVEEFDHLFRDQGQQTSVPSLGGSA
jgi:TIR domain